MDPREYPRDVQIISRAPRLTKKRQRDLEYDAIQNQIEELFQRVAQLERSDFERALEEDEKVCPFVDDGLCLGPAMVDTLMVHQEVACYPFDVSEDSFDNYVDLIGDPIFDTYGDEELHVNVVCDSIVGQQILDSGKKYYFFTQVGEPEMDVSKEEDVDVLPKFWSDIFEVEVRTEVLSRDEIFFNQLVIKKEKIHYFLEENQRGLMKIFLGECLQAWPFDPGISNLQANKTRGRVFFKSGRMMHRRQISKARCCDSICDSFCDSQIRKTISDCGENRTVHPKRPKKQDQSITLIIGSQGRSSSFWQPEGLIPYFQ